MGLMLLFGREDLLILWLLLFAAIGLTIFETRELNLDLRTSMWWILLVALTHVVGYLALRVWGSRRAKQDRVEHS